MVVKTKAITEGAIFAAIYAIIFLITRFFISSVDSIIYYFLPIPIAIYSARYNYRESIITTLVIVTLSFIFINPLYALMLHLPNLIIGLMFGLLHKYKIKKSVALIIIFALSFAANLLSVLLFEVISGVGYFDDVVIFISNIFNGVSPSVVNIITSLMYAVLLLDSLIKTITIAILFYLLTKRLNLVSYDNANKVITIRFKPVIGVLMIIFSILLVTIILLDLRFTLPILNIMLAIIACLTTCLSLYVFYQTVLYLSILLKEKNTSKVVIAIVIILALLIYPITVIYGIINNFILRKTQILIN